MKNILLILLTLFSLQGLAAELQLEIKPILAGGLRFGKEDINDESALYVSGKITTMKLYLPSNYVDLNFLSPGLNYQSDGNLALAISPISVTSQAGLTIGLDLIMEDKDVDGGAAGVFLGYRF